MNSAKATVIRVGGNPTVITVRVDAAVGCARCAAGRGCGAGLAGSAAKTLELDLPAPDESVRLQVGDAVTLNLQAGNLLGAAVYAYGVPLAGAATAAAGAQLLGVADSIAVIAALFGLVAGGLISAHRLRQQHCLESWSPRVQIDSTGAEA